MLLAAGTGVGHPGAWAKDWLSAEGVRGPKVLGLRPTHWWVEADPGISARLRAGSAGSHSLAAGPRDSRECFSSLRVGWEGTIPDITGYGVHGILKVPLACW